MNVTEQQLQKIKELYGDIAYENYLTAENAVKGKELTQLDRDWYIGQAYGKPNAYTMQQHRHIGQIITGTEPTQEEATKIVDEALKGML